MKKSVENITALLRSGISGLTLKSDDFRFSELSMFAQLVASLETPLTLVVGNDLSTGEISQLAKEARGYLHADYGFDYDKFLIRQSRKTKVPDAYADYYYLRDIDLRAERLGDCPFHLSLEQCQEFYNQGWLFHTKEDALRVREAMRRAYINEVMAIKGADNILFNRPLRP